MRLAACGRDYTTARFALTSSSTLFRPCSNLLRRHVLTAEGNRRGRGACEWSRGDYAGTIRRAPAPYQLLLIMLHHLFLFHLFHPRRAFLFAPGVEPLL